MRNPLWSCLFAWTSVLAIAGCSEPLTQAECAKLLDHYTELLVRADRSHVTPDELMRIQEDARAKASRDPAFSECSRRVPRGRYECALRATTPDALEQCLL
jgi:hypothetical protein